MVISACLSVCSFFPIITQELLDRFASKLNKELGRTKEIVLAWFKNSKLGRFTLKGKL